jgi:hypothetical protein
MLSNQHVNLGMGLSIKIFVTLLRGLVCKRTIRNMATMRTFEVMSDKLTYYLSDKLSPKTK